MSILGECTTQCIDKPIFKQGYSETIDKLFQTLHQSQDMLQQIADVLGKKIDKKGETIKVVYQDKVGHMLKMIVNEERL